MDKNLVSRRYRLVTFLNTPRRWRNTVNETWISVSAFLLYMGKVSSLALINTGGALLALSNEWLMFVGALVTLGLVSIVFDLVFFWTGSLIRLMTSIINLK